MYKKILAYILTVLTLIPTIPLIYATEITLPSFVTETTTGLFALGCVNEKQTEAWQCWQNKMEEENRKVDPNKKMVDINPDTKYFFMPSGSTENRAIIYNGYEDAVSINSTVINPKTSTEIHYTPNTAYTVNADGKNYTLYFKKSTAEASIYVNNINADGNGAELYNYLSQDKSNSSSATSAIVNSDGTVDNTSIKKIKGRGNTTWLKAKKPFNITYSDNVNIAGMGKGKKFTLLANYQDASLVRNRILYDLSDAVGMPYSSDSRFVDLFMNGVYYGSYQLCQKIEVGKNDVVNDIDDEAYLNDDGTVAKDFPFLMEIDPNAGGDDFNFRVSGNSVTVKAPELTSGDVGYNQVKYYVTSKFTKLMNSIKTSSTRPQLDAIIDIDSFTKIYLINELGKNWDSGVSSLYMVYKQDSQGNWKFFASPVWDYDNSLGNALGAENELKSMNLTTEQYTSPTGWWCKRKGSSNNANKRSNNVLNIIANCKYIQEYSAQIWFDEFVPALNTFNLSNVSSGEIYSSDVYYNILKGTANCNYTRGWFLNTNFVWIADHSSLINGNYNPETGKFTSDNSVTTYPSNFKGEFDYTVDWLNTRSAWLSAQLKPSYLLMGDANSDNVVNIKDVTAIQRISVGYTSTSKQKKTSDINLDGTVNIIDATILQKRLVFININ